VHKLKERQAADQYHTNGELVQLLAAAHYKTKV
jgi:hypothetical protein